MMKHDERVLVAIGVVLSPTLLAALENIQLLCSTPQPSITTDKRWEENILNTVVEYKFNNHVPTSAVASVSLYHDVNFA